MVQVMKHILKDFFNFERKRSHKEAAIFLVFHSFLILTFISLVELLN